jgi:hypothetical protein
VTAPDATTTYRYVADGSLAAGANRAAMARLRNPWVLAAFVLVGLSVGTGSSLSVNAASLPYFPGRVLLIGLLWGLGWLLVVAVLIGVLVVPLGRVANRRMVRRRFPDGSVTEVELGRDTLVIRRPARTRSAPYGAIRRVRANRSFVVVELHGRLLPELLPLGLLPDDAIDLIRTRSRGVQPATAAAAPRVLDREMVVPAGWSAHVAGVATGAALRSRGMRVWFGVVLLVSLLLAAVADPAWLLLVPVLTLPTVVHVHVGTSRAVARALPTGSVASTEFSADRFVSRNVGGVREIRFDDIRSTYVRGDVVLLRLASSPRPVVIARDLVPEDRLERFPR